MSQASKRAVVVGGATGIGAGICRALAARGYRIALCDIDDAGAQALAAGLPEGAVVHYRVDVTDADSLAKAQAAIRTSRDPIDLVFANAGAISLKPFLDSTDEDWAWLFEVNFFGTVKTIRTFLPGLLAQAGRSRLCVTSSVAALRTPPMVGQTMYMASKSAQLGLANALRTELEGTQVDLSVIFPGAVSSSLRAKSEAKRPGAVALEVPAKAVGPGMMSPEEAGERIVADVERGRPFICTHPGEARLVREMHDQIMKAAFEGGIVCGR